MDTFIAFLRGINVGGTNRIPMKELKKHFEELGFTDIKTILATGNVLFKGEPEKVSKLPTELSKKIGFDTHLILFPYSDIESIIDSDPFKGLEISQDIKFYISFFTELKESKLEIPYNEVKKGIHILNISDKAIFSTVDLKKSGTVELMKILDKEFGKKLTTRNYNTLLKLHY